MVNTVAAIHLSEKRAMAQAAAKVAAAASAAAAVTAAQAQQAEAAVWSEAARARLLPTQDGSLSPGYTEHASDMSLLFAL